VAERRRRDHDSGTRGGTQYEPGVGVTPGLDSARNPWQRSVSRYELASPPRDLFITVNSPTCQRPGVPSLGSTDNESGLIWAVAAVNDP
jgi:hypothetical protein